MLRLSLIIGLGGFIGSISRYWLSLLIDRNIFGAYPYGTFVVNMIGCFFMGLLYYYSEKQQLLTHEMRFFLATGFCGSFTTFSTFSLENNLLLKEGEYSTLITYIVLSILLGIGATIAGIWFGKTL